MNSSSEEMKNITNGKYLICGVPKKRENNSLIFIIILSGCWKEEAIDGVYPISNFLNQQKTTWPHTADIYSCRTDISATVSTILLVAVAHSISIATAASLFSFGEPVFAA